MEENYKLNPEIKEQFDKLNHLIEQEIKKSHEDTLAEAIRDTWGDELKNSDGYDILNYAVEISKTTHEAAQYGLEDAFRIMHDEAAGTITDLVEGCFKLNGYWNELEDGKEGAAGRVKWRVKQLVDAAKKADVVLSLWEYRSNGYREEIEELKNKLKEAS